MGLAETAELAVRISLKDNASGGIRGLQKNLSGLSGSVGRVGKGVGQIGAGFARAGLVVGGAVVSGLTAVTKATIDFEDAFAGVAKTVEGTPAQLDAVYGSLRQLATRIPVKFTDLAAIAQEAGALGVARNDVVGFTDVVARLSAATVGLSTDAAAEAFGKLGNVLFTTKEKANGLIDEYNRMGSALVALGNAGASSEGDIIEVAKRFGAAGHAAGLTAAQILGMSSAVASLGVEPEAAGSALSRLFTKLTTNLALGNDKAKAFGASLGLTAEQAKKAFGKDSLGTFETFLKKLSGMDKFAQAKALNAIGINNIRDQNVVRLLSQQYAELDRQVKLSTKAYDENTQLAEVSAKRFDTLKNKLITLKNLFFDAAVTVGSGFSPALGRAADKLRAFLLLDSNQTALKNLGKDIGDAIDKIDWGAVVEGAKSFVGIMKGALSFALLILQAIDKLPGAVKEAGLGFLALNKLSGGLIGAGVGNVVGGLAGAASTGLGSRLPGVGKLFAQPVYITGAAPGVFGGLGGAGAAGGAAGAVGGKASLLSSALKILGVVSLAELANEISPQINQAGADIHNQLGIPNVLGDFHPSDLQWPFGPKNTPSILPELLGGNGLLGGTPSTSSKPTPVSDYASERGITQLQKAHQTAVANDQRESRALLGQTRLASNEQKSRLSAAVEQLRATKAAQIAGSDRITRAVHAIPPPRTSVHVTGPTLKIFVSANSVYKQMITAGTYTASHVGAFNKAGGIL